MTNNRDTKSVERYVQLGIGASAFFILAGFLYIELMNPGLRVSDRTFWLLAGIAASALALRGLQGAGKGGGGFTPMGGNGGEDR